MSEPRFWANYALRTTLVLVWTAIAGQLYGPWFAAIVAALMALVVSAHAGRFKDVVAEQDGRR